MSLTYSYIILLALLFSIHQGNANREKHYARLMNMCCESGAYLSRRLECPVVDDTLVFKTPKAKDLLYCNRIKFHCCKQTRADTAINIEDTLAIAITELREMIRTTIINKPVDSITNTPSAINSRIPSEIETTTINEAVETDDVATIADSDNQLSETTPEASDEIFSTTMESTARDGLLIINEPTTQKSLSAMNSSTNPLEVPTITTNKTKSTTPTNVEPATTSAAANPTIYQIVNVYVRTNSLQMSSNTNITVNVAIEGMPTTHHEGSSNELENLQWPKNSSSCEVTFERMDVTELCVNIDGCRKANICNSTSN